MSRYDWEYFCGANIVLFTENMPLLEAAGISYNLIDSSAPVYGYCSQLFDAIAPGQILVQGSLVINFVHSNYLYEAIWFGRERSGIPPAGPTSPLGVALPAMTRQAIGIPRGSDDWGTLLENISSARADQLMAWEDSFWDAFRTREGLDYFGTPGLAETHPQMYDATGRPLSTPASYPYSVRSRVGSKYPGLQGPVNIDIKFADKYLIRLTTVQFIGRGTTIQIDENVVLEEYPFFARNMETGYANINEQKIIQYRERSTDPENVSLTPTPP
jgi:hypothetical protein